MYNIIKINTCFVRFFNMPSTTFIIILVTAVHTSKCILTLFTNVTRSYCIWLLF